MRIISLPKLVHFRPKRQACAQNESQESIFNPIAKGFKMPNCWLFLSLLCIWLLPQNANAQISRAIHLSDNQDYVEVPHSSSFNFGGDFTVEFWVKPNLSQTDISEAYNNILVKSYNYTGAIPFGFQYLNSGANAGKVQVIRKNSAGDTIPSYISSKRINDGKFHHLALVKDGSNLKLYIDTTLQVGVSDITGTINNNNSVYLGRSGEGKNAFSGSFDELRIWGTARTAANILTDMTSTAPSTCLAYYNMETGLKNKGTATSVHGFLGGNALFFPTSKSYGNALAFDGNNDFVNLATTPANTLSNQITVEAWIRPEDLNTTQVIATQAGKWELKLVGGKPSFTLNTTTGNTLSIYTNNALASTEKWYHIAALFNGTSNRIELYVNGELENSLALGTNYSIATAGTGMMVGATGSTTSPKFLFKGMIDEVNLWKITRTLDQIIADMNTGESIPNANHLAYFTFDQGVPASGNAGVDTLTNTFAYENGTLMNFALSGTRSNWVARAAYLAMPNATLLTGNTYTFSGNINQMGTGQLLNNGFLKADASIAAYPKYNNDTISVLQAPLSGASFSLNADNDSVYKSYAISTEGLSISEQSTGPCATGFRVSDISFTAGSNSLTALWGTVAGATSYDWALIAPNGDIKTPDQSGNQSTNSVLLSNLDPGSRYYFYVRAKCGGGEGEWVGPAFFATQATGILDADYLENDAYIEVEWALPAAYFVQNAPLGVHIQLKSGTTLLHEQHITDYSSYQGGQQATFSHVATGNLQQYHKVENTNAWAGINAWTLETWVKMGATNIYSTRLFQNRGGSTPFSIWLDSTDRQVKLNINGTDYAFSHSFLPVEQWFHLAVSYGNENANLYVDGTLVASRNVPAFSNVGGEYQFLYACNQTAIAEVRFWNRLRNVTEIKGNRFVGSFLGAVQNNLLFHWKWQSAVANPLDLATTYDGQVNNGRLYNVGGTAITNISHQNYVATPYYSAIHGIFKDYTGDDVTKTYKLNGYQIGSGTIINATYFPPLATGRTLAYQEIEALKADSTPFDVQLSWKNKSKMSEHFRIRRTDNTGNNSVTLATIAGTDKLDSVFTFLDTYKVEDSTATSLRNGVPYRYYVDTYSSTFNENLDALQYAQVSLPPITVSASDDLYADKVELTWNNLADFGYEIGIERDGEKLATLNASLTSYTDLYPTFGKRHRYGVLLLEPGTNKVLAAGFDRGNALARGAISGAVYSAEGGFALPNVQLILVNQSTETQYTSYTNVNGAFSFSNLYYGKEGEFSLSAHYTAGGNTHVFFDSPRTLSLSDENPTLEKVIFEDSTAWAADSIGTGFTLSNFTATPMAGLDKVNLSWNYSITPSDILQVNIYRDGEVIQVLNLTSDSSMSIIDSLGKPNFVYDYRISMYKFVGNAIKVLSRERENIIFPAMSVPTAFAATVSTTLGVVNLAWTHSSTNYDGFKIYRAKQTNFPLPSPPSDTVLIATLPSATFNFTDLQTLPGTSGYKYVIRAYRKVENLTFESAKVFSATVNYPTIPNLSILSAAANPIRNSVSLTWTLPAGSPLNNTSYHYDGYLVYRKKNVPANSPYELVGRVYKHFPRAFEDKSGLPSVAYTYQVKAFLQNISPKTNKDTILLSAGILRGITYPAVKPPAALTLSNNTNYVNLSWTPAGGARNFDGQMVYWRVGTVTDSAEVSISKNTYTHYTNFTSASPTTFSVRSYRKIGGLRYYSTAIIAVGYATGANTTNIPLPQAFKASQNLPAHIRLSWNYPAYVLATFKIYRDGTLVAILAAEEREWYDYNAANYQSYVYEIEASYGTSTTLKATSIGKRNALSSLMGRVYANNSQYGLPYIEVTASASGYFARAFTDSTGFYRIDNLPTQQSLVITVSVNGGNTLFSNPTYPASKTFSIEGERYKTYTMDFVSAYSPQTKDTARGAHIAYLSALPDPARKQVNIAWSPSNGNHDGFNIYRANTLIGTVGEGDGFVFHDTEGTLGINYLYSVLPFYYGQNGLMGNMGKSTSATYPPVQPVVYLNAYPKAATNAVEITWSHLWANHQKYLISKNGTLVAESNINAPTIFTDTSGIPGQLYTYSLVAADSVNGAWIYSEAKTVNVTFPTLAEITDFSLEIPNTTLVCGTAISKNHVLLQWAYPSKCTGFWVYREDELIKTLPADLTLWRDSSGLPGSMTSYKIKAYLSRDNVNYSSDPVSASILYPIIAPVYDFTYTAVPVSGTVLLEWKYAENLISGFQVYRMSGTYGTELIETIKIDSLRGRDFSYWDKTSEAWTCLVVSGI